MWTWDWLRVAVKCPAPAPPSELVGAGLFVPLDAEPDQAVAQIRVRQAVGLPELGVDAGLGEAGHGVDLVDEDLAVGLDEEVAAGEAGAAGAVPKHVLATLELANIPVTGDSDCPVNLQAAGNTGDLSGTQTIKAFSIPGGFEGAQVSLQAS